MNTTVQYIGDWGHILAAALFAALSIWTGRRFVTERAGKLLVAALALTSAWLLSIAFGGVDRLESGVMESLRNCGWLVCLFVLPNRFGGQASRQARGARPLYLALALLLVAQSGVDLLANLAASEGAHIIGLADSAIVLRILWAIGALLLTQRIFIACPARVRAGIAPLAAAMTAMWGYDLVLYGAAFFNAGGMVKMLYALRGLNMAALAPVIALSSRTVRNAALQPSRVLAWRGLGVAVGIILALLILSALMALGNGASPVARTLAAAVLFLAVAGTLLFVPATRLHRTAKVLAAKHLFRHRYDYREQWMAFADTLGGDAHTSIHNRALKAMADITQSSCGALLLADSAEDGRFVWLAEWNWKGEHPEALQFAGAQYARMRAKGWITDINEARGGNEPLPLWLAQERSAWALVPLVHFGEQIGLVLLGHPPITRALDWEDFDMLRAAARQVASYLAEARGQAALAEARRFEEFNRRFAFIMHDIKNLVSQIALTARNAERHADNPDFRADMILTLKDCAERMNTLLARLSQQSGRAEHAVAPFALGDALHGLATQSLLVEGDRSLLVRADRAALAQVLGHLVQNAVEASEAGAPVLLRIEPTSDEAVLHVIDHGCGMSADFLRDELFRPFASTKQGGFGIGAYEARELVRAMGGSLTVESALAKGSIFTIRLPLAQAHAETPLSTGHGRAA
jgi:putative PEP-CTERM system histidine kinase